MTLKVNPKTSSLNCFVIMPISDPNDYDTGHFSRVYSHLIKPACTAAGVSPIRADEVKSTNYIVIDILKRILQSDIVLCDLSAKNPNVMYELGIRQAFNLPSILIKDKRTERVFDIQGIRTVEYDENLRVDVVEKDISNIKTTIQKTIADKGKDINSLIQLLGMPKAKLSSNTEISQETTLILEHIRDISQRITRLEDKACINSIPVSGRIKASNPRGFILPRGETVAVGDAIYKDHGGPQIGYFQGINADGTIILSEEQNGDIPLLVMPGNPIYDTLTIIPF